METLMESKMEALIKPPQEDPDSSIPPTEEEKDLGLVTLDQNGDVIFEIEDPESQKKLSVRVSTKVLCLASPMFTAMFGPRFAEGQKLDLGEPTCVKLEDDVYAMKIMLEALHHHHSAGFDSMKAEGLANLAIHCDKYDCMAALRPWVFCWFHSLEKSVQSPEDLGFLLLAAYRFREHRPFTNVSAIALKRLNPKFATIWSFHEKLNLLPESLNDAISAQLQRVLHNIHTLVQSATHHLDQHKMGYEMPLQECLQCGRTLPETAHSCLQCSNTRLSPKYCTASVRLAEYIGLLEKASLWPSVKPFESRSVSSLVHQISWANKSIKHLCSAKSSCPLIRMLQDLSDKAHQIQQSIQGLCLNRVREADGEKCSPCACTATKEEPRQAPTPVRYMLQTW